MHGKRHTQRGAALVAAVALLAVFAMLGVSYIRYMTIEEDRVRWQTRGLRADVLAEDYLRIAIHELDAVIADGEAVPAEWTFPHVPVYLHGRAGPDSLADSESLRAEIRVTVHDEAGKLDLNRASPALIMAVTGLDEAAATRIRENTRSPYRADLDGRLPFRTLEELKTRGLLDDDAYDALPAGRLTVYSGPGPLLNANAMPEDMLAAVLGVDEGVAAALVAERPFASRDALQERLGEERSLPAAVGVSSNCYRLRCEVILAQPAGEGWRPTRTQHLEAVVAFGAEAPRVLHWQPVRANDDEESAS